MHYSIINSIKFWFNIFNILLGIILTIAIVYLIFISQPQKKLHQKELHQHVEIIVPEDNSSPDNNFLGSDSYV